MSDVRVPVPVETLLEHRAFVRAVARDLCRDDAQADDVTQETMLAALRRPPEGGRPLRPWFARVARNFASKLRRGDARRWAREQALVARTEEVGPLDAVARLDVHRALVDEVSRLEEPFRTAILLRYFDGLDAAAIGVRTSCPATTVRTRIKRGLDRLRERLDARHGTRDAWVSALLPIVGGIPGGPGRSSRLPSGVRPVALGAALAATVVVALSAWRRPEAASPGRNPRETPVAANGRAAHGEPRTPAAPSPRDGARAGDEGGTTRTVSGRVTSPDGTPCAGASVEVTVPTGPPASVSTRSQADGAFRLARVPARVVHVQARSGRSISAVHQVDATQGDIDSLSLVLAPTTRLAGTLAASDSLGVRGATVIVERAASDAPAPPTGDAQTVRRPEWVAEVETVPDETGAWTAVIASNTGHFRVTATAPGRLPAGPVSVRLTPDREPPLVDLTFPETGEFTGTVVSGRTGRAIPGARVTLTPLGSHAADPRPAEATTDLDGHFRFELVAAGPCLVGAEAADHVAVLERCHVPGATRIELAVVGQPVVGQSSIAGRVRFADGAPAPGVQLVVRDEREPEGGVCRLSAGEDGSFVVPDLNPGNYRIRVWRAVSGSASNVLPADAGPFTAGTSGIEIVLVRGRTVRGRVIDESGNAVASAAVNALPAGREDVLSAPSGFQQTDAAGRFEISGLDEGDYAFHVWPPADRGEEFALHHGPGRQVASDEYEIVLTRGLAIEGRVTGEDGAPLPRGSIRAVPLEPDADPEPVSWRSGRIGSDGRFVVSGLTRGHYRLQLLAAGGRPGSEIGALGPLREPSPALRGGERVAAGTRGIDLRAHEGLRIHGRVVDEADRPVADAQVWVQAAGSKDTIVLYTRPDGAFNAFGLDAGIEYALHAFAQGFEVRRHERVLAGGSEMVVRMSRGLTITGRVTDADGVPVAKAVVRLFPVEGGDPLTDTRGGTTGEDGRFVAAALREVAYGVRVGLAPRDGSEALWLDAGTVRGGDQGVEIRLPR